MHLTCECAARGGCVGTVDVFHHFPKKPGIEEVEALCAHHATQRGYFTASDKPFALPTEGSAHVYGAYLVYREAKRRFVQTYDPTLVCRSSRHEECSSEVTNCYFSDGSMLPVCTAHREESCALMSAQYHDEVYELKHEWTDAHCALMRKQR